MRRWFVAFALLAVLSVVALPAAAFATERMDPGRTAPATQQMDDTVTDSDSDDTATEPGDTPDDTDEDGTFRYAIIQIDPQAIDISATVTLT